MNKLPKGDRDRVATLCARIGQERDALESALADLDELIEAHWQEHVLPRVEALSEDLDALQGLRDDVTRRMGEYSAERSTRWAESNRGEDYETWACMWEGVDIPSGADLTFDLEMPAAPELPELPFDPESPDDCFPPSPDAC